MINDMMYHKLENFFEGGFVKDTIKLSIVKNSIDNSYELFDKYMIKSSDKKFLVENKTSSKIEQFYSLQNAVIWCIYQQKNKIVESNRIEILDKMLEGLTFSINLLKNLIKKSINNDDIFVYIAKLSEDEAKKKKLLSELNKYKNQAKFWQFNRVVLRG